VTDLALDAQTSSIRIHTFAEGLFARLAHDLELVCGSLRGSASREAQTATIEVPLSGIEVSGVLKNGRLDEGALSAGDRRDILDKMRREVFHASADAVVKIEAKLDGGDVRARLELPSGRTIETKTRATLNEDRVSGSIEISLSAIGSDVVKGPMNAFRVKDVVVVRFDVAFRQPA
jgi:hypothetical protein